MSGTDRSLPRPSDPIEAAGSSLKVSASVRFGLYSLTPHVLVCFLYFFNVLFPLFCLFLGVPGRVFRFCRLIAVLYHHLGVRFYNDFLRLLLSIPSRFFWFPTTRKFQVFVGFRLLYYRFFKSYGRVAREFLSNLQYSSVFLVMYLLGLTTTLHLVGNRARKVHSLVHVRSCVSLAISYHASSNLSR